MVDSTEKHRVIIIGGGLAGVSSAIALRLAGINDVVILEAASKLTEVGAGIQITPNASRILQDWGLERELDLNGVKPTDCFLRRWENGRILTKFNLTPDHLNKYGAPFWDFHRADLHQVLINRAIELKVDIRCSRKVVDIDFDRGIVITEDLKAYSTDLIIAADGLYSTCRSRLPTKKHNEDLPQPTGDVAYRIVLRKDQIQDDPQLLDMLINPQVNYWVGPDSHVVSYVLRGGTMLNIVLLCPDDTADHVKRVDGDVSQMRQIFRNWDPLLRKLLDRVPTVMKWKLTIRPPIESWLHNNGKFLMIGDAAHTMLPYLSQGAAIAIEDAAVLGEIVKRAGITFDSLKLYEAIRKKRAEKVVAQSEYQRNSYHMHDGPKQRDRDVSLSQEPRIGDHWQWRDPVFAQWLYGYDYVNDVQDALATWNYD